MTNKIHNTTQFNYLLSLLVDGNISPEQMSELTELAKSDLVFTQQLQEQLQTDHLLQQLSNADSEKNFISKVLSAIEAEPETTDITPISAVPAESIHNDKTAHVVPFIPWLISAMSVAACLIIVVTFWINSHHSNQDEFAATTSEQQDTGVAIVVNVISSQSQPIYQNGDSIHRGEIDLQGGFLELEFYQGARIKIAGPAKLDVINDERIRLHYGKVMTDVPKVAIGFTIETPNSDVVDLGTEIGVYVDHQGQSQVHVFDGLAEARSKTGSKQLLRKGEGVSITSSNQQLLANTTQQMAIFDEFNNIEDLTYDVQQNKHAKWLALKNEITKDPSLIAYYDFEKDSNKPRVLRNIQAKSEEYNGAIVGARWTTGPWPNKSALNFKRAGDRVRIDIDHKLNEFTFAIWVRIDSLDRFFNSLLLTDSYKKGNMHWQISKKGKLILGLSGTQGNTKNKGANHVSSPFFTLANSGRWYHLAVVVDPKNQKLTHYVNGEVDTQSPLIKTLNNWQIGQASIGNWDPANPSHKNPIRNLNGSIAEMMIFDRALTASEIAELALF